MNNDKCITAIFEVCQNANGRQVTEVSLYF